MSSHLGEPLSEHRQVRDTLLGPKAPLVVQLPPEQALWAFLLMGDSRIQVRGRWWPAPGWANHQTPNCFSEKQIPQPSLQPAFLVRLLVHLH